MNAISVIAPYEWMGMWVFDDPVKGLNREPFVGGTDIIISQMVRHLPDPGTGFRMMFSGTEFPGYQHRLNGVRAESSGNVYRAADFGLEGWLCPALLKYFGEPPARTHVRVEAKPA